MDYRVLIGEEVFHTRFQTGVIQDADEEHLSVYFEAANKSCSFAAPSCFGSFIKMKDAQKQEMVKAEYAAWYTLSGEQHKDEMRNKMKTTQEDILRREKEREERRIAQAKQEQQRIKEFGESIFATSI